MRLFLAILFAATLASASDELPLEMTQAPLPHSSPVPAMAALGRLLFFDPILSATQTVACATCHHPRYAWADGRSTPIGVGGEGIGPRRKLTASSPFPPLKRNTPSLLNVAYNGMVHGKASDPSTAPMFWDSRAASLEAQALVPMRSNEEMRGDQCSEAEAVPKAIERIKSVPEYVQKFSSAFPGEAPVSAIHLAQALAAFERTLSTPDTLYDQFMRGDTKAMNDQQVRGMKVFREAGCQHCHGGPMLSDFKLHFIGIANGERREFRTPTLRNLKHTAPFMHDGSMKSLEDVLVFYEQLSDAASETLDGADQAQEPPLDPLLKKLNLKPEDFPALSAFILEALSSTKYDTSMPESVPSGLPVPRD